MTTANLRIVPYNLHDVATLTTSVAAATGFPITETQNSVRGYKWLATSNAGQYIRGTIATNKSANFIALFRHTCHGGSIRVQLFSDTAWVTQVYDSTAVLATQNAGGTTYDWGLLLTDPLVADSPFVLHFGEQTFKSYQITFSGTPTATAWSISRIVLGKYFETSINASVGSALGFGQATDTNRSRGGSLRTNSGEVWKTLDLTLNQIRSTDRATWIDIMAYCGSARDFAVSLFAGDGTRLERDHTINAKFANLNAIGIQVPFYTGRFQLQEC